MFDDRFVWRLIDMNRHRQPGLIRDLFGCVERNDTGGSARCTSDPHLDANDKVSVALNDLQTVARC